MVNFPDLDPSLVLKKEFDPNRESKYRNIGSHSIMYFHAMENAEQIDGFTNTWGYTTFRTDYSSPDSDARFAKAAQRMEAYAVNWLFDDLNGAPAMRGRGIYDPRVMCEVRARLQNKIIEDRAALDGATREKVGEIFDAWTRIYKDDPWNWRNPRLQYAIMLDKESIDNILALPEEPKEAEAPECYWAWIKVVTNKVRDGRRLWLRVGVYDVLWEHWFAATDNEFDFEEYVAEYDEEEGVVNLYGPPEMSVSPFAPLDFNNPPPKPMDIKPGHPARPLANIIYGRLEAPKAE